MSTLVSRHTDSFERYTAPRSGARVQADMRADLRILVVEDERTLREGCTAALQAEGHDVTSVGRGDEALQRVTRRTFDIILLDQFMTPVPGLEIMKAALAARKETIVIFMTGNASVTSSLEALHAGAWDYLPKPFAAAHLQVL